MEQLHLPSFGVPRRPVHVRHWRCALFSERLCAAADTLQEDDVATANELEDALQRAVSVVSGDACAAGPALFGSPEHARRT